MATGRPGRLRTPTMERQGGRRWTDENTQQIDTIVIGAGQAGLSAGYHLAKRGLPFAILDADARIGDHWRDRWDTLRLYSPARYDSLPGMRFPAPSSHWPTGREMGDYLEAYAATVPPARQERDARRSRRADRRRLRRVDRGRRAPRCAPGHRRDRAVPAAERPGLRHRPRPVDRADALARVPQPGPAARRAPSSSSACRIPVRTSRSRPPRRATRRSSPASHMDSCRSR